MREATGNLTAPTVRIERRLRAPIERVWAYLTDAALLPAWFCPGTVSPQAGGRIEFAIGATGRVTVYDPPHVLEYTWSELELSRGPFADSVVRWELIEDGDGVLLTLTHALLPEREIGNHRRGWDGLVDRLAACVAGAAPEPFDDFVARLTLANAEADG